MAVLRKRRFDELDPFSDLLFNTLLAFVMLFAIALIAMNPKAKTGVIDAKAEFIVTVTWPDMDPNDIDTWVQDPGGNLVWFRAREGGMMHLDRDDRGVANDTIVINGQQVVTVRGFAPGEYTVNVFYYETKNGQPVPVNISVVKVNPRAEVAFYGSVTLPRKGDEATAVRFTVDRDGQVTGVNTLAKTLVQRQ
jgi:hypothetical protein